MAETITSRVLDALANAGLLTVEQISSIMEAVSASGGTAGDVLLQRDMATGADIEAVMESELGMPRVDLSSYAPDDEALRLVPAHLARERGMLPLFEIEGMLTVAIGDPMHVFDLDELAATLGLEIEAVLSDGRSVSAAIAQYYGEPADEVPPVAPVEEAAAAVGDAGTGASAAPAPEAFAGESPPAAPAATFVPDYEVEIDAGDLFEAGSGIPAAPVATPAAAGEPEAEPARTIEEVVGASPAEEISVIDLDVLAVADARKVAVLVSEILEHAVAERATHVHLLPYKDDFFLVYRIAGRLERVASAPLSMQAALVEGFKNLAHLSMVQSSRPALGRVKAKVGDRDLVLTVSAVPTVTGQRVVLTLDPDRPSPRGLSALGMNEAEVRALHAMVERGRGILLVCAPVAGGRSSTYYALLNHAAQAGKTVYSVERSVEYEIPAVSQVLVNPGSPVGAESYFAAGMRQDTDVMAIDALQSVEDVHLAIEAAGMGKLVIATFTGADIVSGVDRMLELGAEPVSLASALTLGVGQRLVRMNCPHCSAEGSSPLADSIPGAEKGMSVKTGAGCPSCANTGFQGTLGLFEVLPFTDPVRNQIARGASAAEIASAAAAAGMRSMIASGLAHVRSGQVGPDELNRVLRFAVFSS